VSLGETPLDCPWAAIARDLSAANDVKKALHAIAPGFVARLRHEAKIAGPVKNLWGRSINFDEGVKGTIIAEPVIDAILEFAGVYPRQGRIVHAGFEHTYGYLLSTLQTSYGYKRLRWVRPDIEKGFGLEPTSISPTPRSGGLLMNVSVFAGSIAFRENNAGDREALKILRRAKGVSSGIKYFNYQNLHGRRLTETVRFTNGRVVEIRTDFVPFTEGSMKSTGGNSELLIYSIRDSAEKLPYLISAFPIAKGFSDNALKEANLGQAKAIVTRYNAYVPGLTDSRTPLTGERKASTF
jgi:hypothetical protein